jgi:hypothetical protein
MQQSAVILLFPVSESRERRRKEEDSNVAQQTPVDPTIFFIKQTVS